MKQVRILLTQLSLISLLFCSSCKKWLDLKANKSDIVPQTLVDFQGMMDNSNIMNITPGLASVGMDNYYVTYSDWLARDPIERASYTWATDIFQGQTSPDWNQGYKTVEFGNIVLEGLTKINTNLSNQSEFNNIKGQALFFRAKAFLDLASLFSKPYSSSTAQSDLGIPIRLESDVNIKSVRASVQDTYDRIINDLKEAIVLLPVNSVYQTRPSRTAAQALLGRAFLNIGDYDNALQYSNLALTSYNTLIDYNTLPTTTYPFPRYPNNKEVIFWSRAFSWTIVIPANSLVNVDTVLYNSYASNDLRKVALYSVNSGGRTLFDGSYLGSTGALFSGLGTNELFLIRAESNARLGNFTAAMKDLNDLLRTRWKIVSGVSTYVDQVAANSSDALLKILTERRKELPFTESVRWDDLRRLNKDPQFAKTLTRILNGNTYTLPPNDNKYVYPIPPDEILLSGIQQSPR